MRQVLQTIQRANGRRRAKIARHCYRCHQPGNAYRFDQGKWWIWFCSAQCAEVDYEVDLWWQYC